MTTWSDISFNPPARTLRQFAGLWLVFFGGFACLQAARHGWTTGPIVLAALALGVGPAGLWKPALVRPVYVGAMVATFPIGWVVSHVVLAVLYYGIFTPLGLFFRLTGRDALGLKRDSARDSYWHPKPAPADVGRYFRQF